MLSLIILAEEEREELNGVHFGADTNEIIWGTLGFLVIMFFFVAKGLPVVRKAMAARTSRIETELADARAARDAAEAALTESTSELPDVGEEADRIRAEAIETAARLKVDLVEKAKADAIALTERGASDVENSKRQALADLSDEVARMTRGATEAVVMDSLDEATHVDLIDSYIEKLGQL